MSDPEHSATSVDAASGFDPIVPIDFTPPDPGRKRRTVRLGWPHLLVAGFLLLAGVASWFVLSAKSVFVQVDPITAAVDIQSGFAFPLGQRYLMLEGDYQVRVSHEGYHEEQWVLTVDERAAQNHPVPLRELPGIVTFEASEANARSTDVSGAVFTLDGVEVGRTPRGNIE